VADNSTYREAALGEYRELSWHVESIACHGRESYYAALQVSRDTKEAAKALGLDPCDHVDVSQHGSGYECSVWILTSPEFESLRN